MKDYPKIRVPAEIQERAKELRKRLTPAEERLWEVLRNRRLGGYKFRRQHPIGVYIADFYCDRVRLVIEVDGAVHDEEDQIIHDAIRDEWLRENMFHVIRIKNSDVFEERGKAILWILTELKLLDNKD